VHMALVAAAAACRWVRLLALCFLICRGQLQVLSWQLDTGYNQVHVQGMSCQRS
jgi:hypothetical protein